MQDKKRFTQVAVILLIGILVLAFPGAVMAQETDPPAAEAGTLDDTPENDILVFEPQFFWELPLAQGFKIIFNFGISFEMPRELTLVTQEAFDFILRFSSYIRENALEPTSTPEVEATPTPEP